MGLLRNEGHWLAIGVLCIALASCSALLEPLYHQPTDPVTGLPTGPAEPVMDEDGTPRTVGEELADDVDEKGGLVAGAAGNIVGALTGNPATGMLAAWILGQLVAGAAGSIRRRGSNAPKPE